MRNYVYVVSLVSPEGKYISGVYTGNKEKIIEA